MAEGKKKVIVYCDWMKVFEALDDDEAGRLIKHFFRYVNDKQPEAPDKLTKISFIPIELALKRDLVKWQSEVEQKRINGIVGNLKRWSPDIYKLYASNQLTLDEAVSMAKPQVSHPDRPRSTPILKVADSVTDNDSVIDNVINKDTLLSQVSLDDLTDNNDRLYFDIAKNFHSQFTENSKQVEIEFPNLTNAKYFQWTDPIRKLIILDNHTIEEIREVYKFLKEDKFWQEQIRSTAKLRQKDDNKNPYFQVLLYKSRTNAKHKIDNTQSKKGNGQQFTVKKVSVD